MGSMVQHSKMYQLYFSVMQLCLLHSINKCSPSSKRLFLNSSSPSSFAALVFSITLLKWYCFFKLVHLNLKLGSFSSIVPKLAGFETNFVFNHLSSFPWTGLKARIQESETRIIHNSQRTAITYPLPVHSTIIPIFKYLTLRKCKL